MRCLLLLSLLFALTAHASAAQEKSAPKTFAQLTHGLQKLDGYFPLYYDAAEGKLLLEIPRFDTEFLYQVSLPTGVGSNPLGLDRGQLGGTHVVRFERAGPKALLVESNYNFRAITPDAAER